MVNDDDEVEEFSTISGVKGSRRPTINSSTSYQLNKDQNLSRIEDSFASTGFNLAFQLVGDLLK